MKSPSKWPVLIKKGNSTVKIYRNVNKGYTSYRVAFYQGGNRKMVTFADFEQAVKRAHQINASVSAGDVEALKLTREECLIFQRATQALNDIGTPLDLAAIAYADATRKLDETPISTAVDFYLRMHPKSCPQKTVTETFTEMMEAKKADGASLVYLKDLRMRCRAFAGAFQCQLSEVTGPLLNEFLRSLKCAGRSRNNYRMAIRTLFSFAESAGYLPKGHLDFEQVAVAKEEEFSIEIFTVDEMRKLLQAARLDAIEFAPGFNKRYAVGQGLVLLFALGAFAGLRTAEIQRQAWSDINLERGWIRVTGVKGNTAQKRLVPISDNLRDWLLPHWRREGVCCDYLNVTDAVYRVAARAGVAWKHNGLRHSFASYRVALTGDVAKTAFECGNSPSMIHRHYRELVTPEDAKAWFGILPDSKTNVVPLPRTATAKDGEGFTYINSGSEPMPRVAIDVARAVHRHDSGPSE